MANGIVNSAGTILALVAALLVLVVVFRIAAAGWYRLRQKGRLPLIVHEVDSEDGSTIATTPGANGELPPRQQEQHASENRAISAMLRAYIAEDVQGTHLVVPGTAAVVTPTIPAQAARSTDRWLSTVLFLTVAQQPAYHIILNRLPTLPGNCRVAVQLIKKPGYRIITAGTFSAESAEKIVSRIGGHCVQAVQQQKHALRRVPRWEHWADRGGYGVFREALADQRDAPAKAIIGYEKAGSLSLGNVTVALRRAEMCEQKLDYSGAVEIYRYTHELWPESIETMYRYAAACSNARDTLVGGRENAKELLCKIEDTLRLSSLIRRWIVTWLPNRCNPGERRYWLSWFRPSRNSHIPLVTRRSKRRDYLFAVAVAREVINIGVICRSVEARPQSKARSKASEVTESFERVTRWVGCGRIGWLAHYNAACFSACVQACIKYMYPKCMYPAAGMYPHGVRNALIAP